MNPRLLRSSVTVATVCAFLCVATTLLLPRRMSVHASELPVTYSGQVAHILYSNCATCHHAGGAGPFSLLTYEDARRWGPQIATVTRSRYMPPWLPEPGYGDFADNRRLSDGDLALIQRWIKDGMPAGDLAQSPLPPEFPSEWTLGQPDLVLSMPLPFTTPADGTDVFRNFILPYPLTSTRYIRAMEILPGGPGMASPAAAVHHANVLVDRTGSYRKQHPEDWQQGIAGMELVVDAGSTFDPDSHFLFWKPDSPAIVEAPGMEWRLDAGDDLILNMHLKPTGKPETIQARIGLYFSEKPATQHPMLLQLEHDAALDIPAGASSFVIEDQLELPVAVKVLGVYPHAHYLGKDLAAYAILPDGKKQWLVWIRDWDIDRQSIYRYKSPLLLPRGSIIHMRYIYDNSAGNPRNPHTPAIRVKAGNRSEDEMGHLWLQVLPVDATTDGRPLTAHNDARLLLEEAWMASRLRKDPSDAMALYNMAAAESEDGKRSDAVKLYRRILDHNARDARTWTALGAALESNGDADGAASAYEQTLSIEPNAEDARFDLAQLEMTREQYSEAEQQLRQLLKRNPQDAAAHSELGLAFLRQNKQAEARSEFEQALALDSQNALALRSLGEMAIVDGNLPEAVARLEAALQQDDNADTHEKLAMAYAQSNRLNDATSQLQRAIQLDPGDAEAHSLLAQVYGSGRHFAEAIREQQQALVIDPSDADGWNNLGVLHAQGGDKADARNDFQRALALSPALAAAAENLRQLGGTGAHAH